MQSIRLVPSYVWEQSSLEQVWFTIHGNYSEGALLPLSIGLLTIMDKTIDWLDSWSKAESLADEMDRKSEEDNTVGLMIYAERWSWRLHSHA